MPPSLRSSAPSPSPTQTSTRQRNACDNTRISPLRQPRGARWQGSDIVFSSDLGSERVGGVRGAQNQTCRSVSIHAVLSHLMVRTFAPARC
eukprot:357293-Chlamydomonas_euryale.AAC.5